MATHYLPVDSRRPRTHPSSHEKESSPSQSFTPPFSCTSSRFLPRRRLLWIAAFLCFFLFSPLLYFYHVYLTDPLFIHDASFYPDISQSPPPPPNHPPPPRHPNDPPPLLSAPYYFPLIPLSSTQKSNLLNHFNSIHNKNENNNNNDHDNNNNYLETLHSELLQHPYPYISFTSDPLLLLSLPPLAQPGRWHGPLAVLRPDGSPAWSLSPAPSRSPRDVDQLVLQDGFNAALSDAIPLDRRAPDGRAPECALQRLDVAAMPQTTVVFVFHDEVLSALLRSVHSVLNTAPPMILRQIILVDDASTRAYLKKPLDDYLQLLNLHLSKSNPNPYFNNKYEKIRLIRLETRHGLSRARMAGISLVDSPTFTILDSHVEAEDGWLEPMLSALHQHPRRAVMPIIDMIASRDFHLVHAGIPCHVGFLWSIVEQGMLPPFGRDPQFLEGAGPATPTSSPAMAGGLFAMHTRWFMEVGQYDEEFGFWGQENVEMSFRMWQCGGELLCAPCSRVHHIFRSGGHPYKVDVPSTVKNRLRTAAVWMDEYAAITHKLIGEPDWREAGNVADRMALRRRLNCSSFDWFLKEVSPETMISDKSDVAMVSDLESAARPGLCVDSWLRPEGSRMSPNACHRGWGGQGFILTQGRLHAMSDTRLCVSGEGGEAQLLHCRNTGHAARKLQWEAGRDGRFRPAGSDRCMTFPKDGGHITVEQCREEDEAQRFLFKWWDWEEQRQTIPLEYRSF